MARKQRWKQLQTEIRALWLLQEGYSFDDIAAELNITPATVAGRVERLARQTINADLDRWRAQVFRELQVLKELALDQYLSTDREVARQILDGSGNITLEETRPRGGTLECLRLIRDLIADQRRLLGLDAPQQTRSLSLNLSTDDLYRIARDIREMSFEELSNLVEQLGVRGLFEHTETGPEAGLSSPSD